MTHHDRIGVDAVRVYFHVFETPDADARTRTYIVIHGHSPVNREKSISLLGHCRSQIFNAISIDAVAQLAKQPPEASS